VNVLHEHRVDAVIVLGGDGTLAASVQVAERGVGIIGIPKTIDNDVTGTEECIGHDTAVMIATEAIDRLHTTAESHDRLMVVEVMGRSAGWIAVRSGIAACADAIVIPEQPVKLEAIAEALRTRHAQGANFSIVVVAEGALFDQGDPSGRNDGQSASQGSILASNLGTSTGFETRLSVLGHIQRGGAPTAHDRLLATHFGMAAVAAARDGHRGVLIGGSAERAVGVPLTRVLEGPRTVSEELQRLASQVTTV
jgi:6-phosphofructokinase 1